MVFPWYSLRGISGRLIPRTLMLGMNNDPLTSDDEFIRRFTNCQRDLRAFIVGMTPTKSDADDVLQEVNLALWRKRELYDPSQEFLRWAFGFALTEVRNFRSRSAKSRMWFNDSALESIATAWPYESNLSERRDRHLHSADRD